MDKRNILKGDPTGSYKNRIYAIITALVVMVSVFSALLFVSIEAGHDCEGEDCPICAEIAASVDALSKIGTGLAVVTVTFFFLKNAFFSCIYNADRYISRATLVSRKTRLNN